MHPWQQACFDVSRPPTICDEFGSGSGSPLSLPKRAAAPRFPGGAGAWFYLGWCSLPFFLFTGPVGHRPRWHRRRVHRSDVGASPCSQLVCPVLSRRDPGTHHTRPRKTGRIWQCALRSAERICLLSALAPVSPRSFHQKKSLTSWCVFRGYPSCICVPFHPHTHLRSDCRVVEVMHCRNEGLLRESRPGRSLPPKGNRLEHRGITHSIMKTIPRPSASQ